MLENWPKGVVCTSGRLLTTLTKLLHIHYVIKYTVAGCLISINVEEEIRMELNSGLASFPPRVQEG